jgi:DHA1 family tetracycline resistance protein-like MFS transporter
LLVVLVNFLGATIVLPTLPVFASREFGAPDSIIPWLNTSYFIAQFIAAPFLGRLSDRYGRLPVLMVSQIGTVISFIMMFFAPNLQILFLARILDGITGGNIIVAQAYITDIAPREQRTRALGLVVAAFGIGFSVGPAIGGVISVFGERAPFIAGALISLATVIIMWLMLDESLSADERLARRKAHVRLSFQDVLHSRALVLILVIGFAAQAAMSMVQSIFPLYGEQVIFAGYDASIRSLGIGLLLGMIGVGQIFTQFIIIPRLLPRVSESRAIVIGVAVRGLAVLSLALVTSPFLLAGLWAIPFAIGAGIMMPSLQSLATLMTDERISGHVLGIVRSSMSLGIITGSFITGHLFTLAPTMPFVVSTLIYVIALVPAFLLQQRKPVAIPAH